MTNDLGADLTTLEARLHAVEQQAVAAHTPSLSVVPNASGTPVVRDSLTYDTGWASYVRLNSAQPNPALPNYPSLSWVHAVGGTPAPWGPPQAIRVGPMCFLTGIVLRTGGLIGAGAPSGARMFMLPLGWRPMFAQHLTSMMNSGSNAPAMSWITIQPDRGSPAGGVYYTGGQAAIDTNGWLSLQAAFPCVDAP